MVSDRAKAIARCHTIATQRLKHAHKAQYTEILADVYAEEGLVVRKRRTKEEILADRLAEARALLESQQ